MSRGVIRHIYTTPFNGYLVGWVDDHGNCHEDLCSTKDDLIKLLDKVLCFDNFERR